MTQSLSDFIEANIRQGGDFSLPKELPLVHTSRCEWMTQLPVPTELQTSHCEIYKECLLYFFYGRPAYRVKNEHVHDIAYCPICFILKPRRTNLSVRRVIPTDSGGLMSGRLEPDLTSKDHRLIQLTSTVRAAQQLVKAIYGSNLSYVTGKVSLASESGEASGNEDTDGSPDHVANRYIEVLKSPSISKTDDRKSVIEFQLGCNVPFEGNLQAVILPLPMLDSKSLVEQLENWGVEVQTYFTFEGSCPSGYSDVIKQMAVKFLQSPKDNYFEP